ncbi:STAS domain-containing protein [archaeon]|jgi:ABC-type transporter Mla MlaB component|nr:STAS domain-containing protein [archaeon]MBT3577414.1 STAS domain-containing protein [archaeon]MBT6820343.1 STAS domain-containing protein [archaeon]MBT6956106.1 STAS domain-containing protein [archaeon]MBT7025157.1 STAS domain-containing protein [archaeon]
MIMNPKVSKKLVKLRAKRPYIVEDLPGTVHWANYRQGIHKSDVESFDRELKQYVRHHPGDVFLDLSNIRELDCAGIGALLNSRGIKKKRGFKLKINGLDDSLKNVVALMLPKDDILEMD